MDEFHARRLVDLYADTILRISYSYLKQTCDDRGYLPDCLSEISHQRLYI